MRCINVKSSSVKRIGYDPKNKILSVEFVDNGPYYYYEVPADVFEGLGDAQSKGEYINRNIRTRYDYSKPGYEL